MNRRRILEPDRLEIFEQPFAPALAAITTFAIAAEAAARVEKIRAVHPHDAGFYLRGDVKRDIDALAPDACGEAVDSVVRKLDGFAAACGKSSRREPGRKFPAGPRWKSDARCSAESAENKIRATAWESTAASTSRLRQRLARRAAGCVRAARAPRSRRYRWLYRAAARRAAYSCGRKFSR